MCHTLAKTPQGAFLKRDEYFHLLSTNELFV